jgi:DNA-binding CsgD family transcriptional regulator
MLGQQVFPAAPPRSRSDSDSPVLAIGQQEEAVHRRGFLQPVPGASQIEIVPPPGPASAGANAFFAKKLGQASIPLSNREEEILERLIAGAPNKVIARDLGITEGTVKVHVKSLCRKLGALNRTQAAIWGQVSRSVPAGDDGGMTLRLPSFPPGRDA